MGTRITLIGRPEIRAEDGEPRKIRGGKTWVLLARILLADRPIARRQLATELFPDTDDPLGSLRWALAELRRAVGSRTAFTGDPVVAGLPAGTWVDALALAGGASAAVDPCGELLDGVHPRCSPEFETWLLVERERTSAAIAAIVRSQLLDALARGDADDAVRLGQLAVSRQPFDESAHVLLVKALVAAGLRAAATRHVATTTASFRSDLGIDPSAALLGAARPSVSDPAPGVSAHATATALLDAGSAALDAGAVDAGIECLRRAVAESDRSGDVRLRATAMLELGTALVHSVRGHDDEGAVLLGQAADLGRREGLAAVAARALQELGYTDALVGRRRTAAAYLGQAALLAGDDDDLRSGVDAFGGFNLSEWGRTAAGLELYEAAVERARRAGKPRRAAWSLGLGARSHVFNDDVDAADDWLRQSLEIVADEQWIAFRPWPAALRAELRLADGGEPGVIREEMAATFALSCQLGDPCWEGTAARVIALTHAADHDFDDALEWISAARRRCTRETDTYVGMEASILDSDAQLAAAAGDADRAEASARELLMLAARTHQDHFVQRAMSLLSGADPGSGAGAG